MKIKYNVKRKITVHIFFTDMDAQDTVGNTPLHLTVEEDAFDAMDYLLSMYVLIMFVK